MILDTNALSAFLDGVPEVVEVISQQDALHLPVIVLGEYRFGLRASKLKKTLEPHLNDLAQTCTVLPICDSTTHTYAQIRQALRQAGTPIPENDIWIAALALEHQLPVLTRDQHFDKIRLIQRVDW